MNVHVLYVLELKKRQKKSVYWPVYTSVCLYVHPCVLFGYTIIFVGGRCLLFEKCSIDVQSKILILILILKILILTKTLQNSTKFGGYLQYFKRNLSVINFHGGILILILKKKFAEKRLRNTTKFHKYL